MGNQIFKIILDTNLKQRFFEGDCAFLENPQERANIVSLEELNKEFLSEYNSRGKKEIEKRKSWFKEQNFTTADINNMSFLEKLQHAMREYGSYSFYNETGFGDLHIIAYFNSFSRQLPLFEKTVLKVYTADNHLRDYLQKTENEFCKVCYVEMAGD